MDNHKLKDNDHKHSYVREQWIAKKRMGRPTQVWVWDIEPFLHCWVISSPGDLSGIGHWEKVKP